jgi:DNA-binding IclR family transcriptional regulator
MPRPEADSQGAYHAQSLTRGLRVLRSLAAAREPLTLQELHETTELPKSTLVRLLAVLTKEGCTVRIDDRPTYSLGPTVLEIAAGVGTDMDPDTLARPRMEVLTATVGHTSNLGVLAEGEVLHVSVVLADRPVRYTAHSGTKDAVWCTGLGKALLAFSRPTVVNRVLHGRRLTGRTPRTLTTRSALDTDLKLTRSRGWSYDDEEGAEGLRCFAVPILVGGECIAALSISGPAAELPKRLSTTVIPVLEAAAVDLAADARLVRGLRALAHDSGEAAPAPASPTRRPAKPQASRTG